MDGLTGMGDDDIVFCTDRHHIDQDHDDLQFIDLHVQLWHDEY